MSSLSAEQVEPVAELALLLPVHQVAALELHAESNGVSSGQLIRRIIAAFLENNKELHHGRFVRGRYGVL